MSLYFLGRGHLITLAGFRPFQAVCFLSWVKRKWGPRRDQAHRSLQGSMERKCPHKGGKSRRRRRRVPDLEDSRRNNSGWKWIQWVFVLTVKVFHNNGVLGLWGCPVPTGLLKTHMTQKWPELLLDLLSVVGPSVYSRLPGWVTLRYQLWNGAFPTGVDRNTAGCVISKKPVSLLPRDH